MTGCCGSCCSATSCPRCSMHLPFVVRDLMLASGIPNGQVDVTLICTQDPETLRFKMRYRGSGPGRHGRPRQVRHPQQSVAGWAACRLTRPSSCQGAHAANAAGQRVSSGTQRERSAVHATRQHRGRGSARSSRLSRRGSRASRRCLQQRRPRSRSSRRQRMSKHYVEFLSDLTAGAESN